MLARLGGLHTPLIYVISQLFRVFLNAPPMFGRAMFPPKHARWAATGRRRGLAGAGREVAVLDMPVTGTARCSIVYVATCVFLHNRWSSWQPNSKSFNFPLTIIHFLIGVRTPLRKYLITYWGHRIF